MNSPTDIVAEVLKTVKEKGASSAEVFYSEGSGISISCRENEVDTIENNTDKSLIITVFKGQASGSASTAVVDKDSIKLSIDKAFSIAQLTEDDPYAGLASEQQLATEFKDLKTYFNNDTDSEQLIDKALLASKSAQAYAQSQGQKLLIDESNIQLGEGYSIYANSAGFMGEKKGSNVSSSLVAIGRDGDHMEREYWWDAVRDGKQLIDPEELGQIAAKRTLARTGARKIKSTHAPVLFDPSMAKTLISHMQQAISGSALYQDASFLKDDLHKNIFPQWFNITEDPFIPSGFASRNFDSNGVKTSRRDLIDNGKLNGFLLSVYSARRLGLETTGNAGGAHNLIVQAPQTDFNDLLSQLDTGLFVTSLMGQGFNAVNGDYSRGASGFWVEKGEIQYPVGELTIAGNLREMFAHLVAVGADVDQRSKTQTGSWLIENMAIAGD